MPPPRWRSGPRRSFSVSHALSQLRAEAWGRALGLDNFPHFAPESLNTTKWHQTLSPPAAAAIYAIR
ncbi:MAG: hypothetical protein ACRD1M_14580 [Terriglobales bacterium]